jgi:hypothetical protein
VLRDQFFDFYPVLDCEFSWPLQITRLTFSPSKVLESFAIPVVSTAKGAHNDTPTIPFHTTLRPTKMMTAHRRRRPTGQAFYLTVFAISLLAAFSLLRSLSGESAAARNSQFLEARMLEQKVKEVWLRPNIYNAFTDWTIVPICPQGSDRRPMCLYPEQLSRRRSRPDILPPALLLLPLRSQSRRIYHPCHMD